jgi:hypothetical protein
LLVAKKNGEDENTAKTPSLTEEEEISIAKAGFSPSYAYKVEGGYIVEGDIFLTPKNLIEQQAYIQNLIDNGAKTEQYRTDYIVTDLAQPLKIKVSAGSEQAYYTTAVKAAAKRYNDLGLKISFTVLDDSSTEQPNITIVGTYLAPSGGYTTLGKAGLFPSSSGTVNTSIQLNNTYYTAASNKPDFITVIAHEIGHTIGFRHTDYSDRNYSCDSRIYLSPEEYLNKKGKPYRPVAEFSAVHIPGTPTGPDADSWMLACSGGKDRPFTSYDLVALKALYHL